MKYIDLFAGIGGFRRGMELEGHECVGFCEYDKFAVASYTAMHLITDDQREYLYTLPLKKRQKEILKEEYRNGEWYANDIRSVDARSIPSADCWCFGFPCQDISIAGNCLGFAGKRSSLFFSVTGLIRDISEEDRPGYLVIENVKNLLSVNRGFDFAKLLIELDEIGYDAEWDVLNSKNFGVPQNRERVFIVGHLRGRGTRKVFPLGETDGVHNTDGTDGQVHEVAQCLTAGGNDKWHGDYIVKQIGNCMPTSTRDNPNQGRIYDTSGIAPCLNKMSGGGREPMIVTTGRIGDHQTDLVQDCEGISRSLKATDYKNPQKIQVPISMTRRSFNQTDMSPTLTASGPSKGRGNSSPVPGVAIPVLTPDRVEKRQNGRRFKENGEPMYTVTSQDRHGVMVSGTYTGASKDFIREPMEGISRCLKSEKNDAGAIYYLGDEIRIRRLTPRECFRLQGWTDDYFDKAKSVNSDSQLYKQAGNGVTVNVIQAIAEKLAN